MMAFAIETDHIEGLESLQITDQHSSITIIPGLISLKLGIVNSKDLHMIEEAKHSIVQSPRDEHPILQNVQDNIIALLQTKIPRERYIAKQTLERIIRDDPNHLNALADLEHIYRNLDRISDANKCSNEIAKILAGTNEEHKESKRISLLEQGYAIRIDKKLRNKNTVDLKVSELQTMISAELTNSSGQRRNCLAKSLHCNKQMLQYLQEERKHLTLGEHIVRINSSVQKFEAALSLFPNKELHPVWNFNFAKSLNQYCRLMENMSAIGSRDRTTTIKEATVRALNLFWQTTEKYASQDYVARSYMYIGKILAKRKHLFIDDEISRNLLFIPNICELLDKPSVIFNRALHFAPKDIAALNSYGRSLWNESRDMEGEEKIRILKSSENILTKSIEIENKRNWFAFSSRLVVRRDIAMSFSQREISSKVEYFELAREDGLHCFRYKGTLKDMTILAEVCQNLAKCPDTTKYGQRFVKPGKSKFIVEAIDLLYYGLRLGDPIEYHSATRMAMCLADLGEVSKAIEWQKQAWLLSWADTIRGVGTLLLFLTLSFEEVNRTTDKKINHMLKDFLYVLKYVKSHYSCENISKIYTLLYKERHKYVLQMIRRSIEELSLFDTKTKEVLLEYCHHVLKFPFNRIERKSTEEVWALLSNEIIAKDREDSFLSIFETKSIEPSTITQSVSFEYECDFFVCFSHTDGEWVNSILLPTLENAYQENDIILKGCIPDRDFLPGKTILTNIVHAIQRSSKIILILTCGFLDSAWCQSEIKEALLDRLEQDRIIPVLFQACDVPDELKHVILIDLTKDELNFEELQRLKNAII